MPKFGDILPNASGRSHIGVDGGTQPGSFDATSMLPFGHVVCLSGVFLDPLLGQSGIVRYNRQRSQFEMSPDGGETFGLHLGGFRGRIDLSNNLVTTVGVGLTELIQANYTLGVGNNLDVAVSGDLTWNVSNNSTIDLGIIADINAVRLDADFSGSADLQANTTLTLTGVTAATLASAGIVSIVSIASDISLKSEDEIALTAGSSDPGDDIRLLAGNMLLHSVYGGSGQMRYEFGPYEAWHVSPSHTSDFFPLPYSGQVEEMIRKDIVPFTSGIHALGGIIDFTQSIPQAVLTDYSPYGQTYSLSGMYVSPIHGKFGAIRYNPANSGMEVTNDIDDTGQGWHPFGQSITRTITKVRGLHDMLHVDAGGGTFARTDPLVISVTDTTTIAGQLFTKGFLTRIPFEFTVPDWVDTNYPITAKVNLLVGNTAPSGAGQQIEIETNTGWNGDNSNFFVPTGSKATATIHDISSYGALDYIELDLGTILDPRSVSNRDLVHGVVKRDARTSNFLDDDYPDAIAIGEVEFLARVKRGYAGEYE